MDEIMKEAKEVGKKEAEYIKLYADVRLLQGKAEKEILKNPQLKMLAYYGALLQSPELTYE